MNRSAPVVNLALRAIALAMAVASIVLGLLGTEETAVIPLLAIGLFALALTGFGKKDQA